MVSAAACKRSLWPSDVFCRRVFSRHHKIGGPHARGPGSSGSGFGAQGALARFRTLQRQMSNTCCCNHQSW